jgi:nucleotide-binding universal stress UspA family protein
MNTPKNILFTTDFSETSENALPYAIDLIKKGNGKLNLLHVYDVPIMVPADAFTSIAVVDPIADVARDIRSIALTNLKKIIKKNKLENYSHRCFVREGSIHDEILDVIEKNEIDLLVIGTKGEDAEEGFFNDSITKNIIQQTSCPVLAIPELASFGKISKIIYATNLQFDETKIINYIVEFAKLYDATIKILHVDENIDNKKWSIDLLEDLIDKVDYPKISYKELVVKDTIAGINDFVQKQKTDIIVMTTYTTNLFDNIFHDSLTKQMLFSTHIPLLSFHKKKYSTFFTS